MLIEFGHKGTAFFANNRIFFMFFCLSFLLVCLVFSDFAVLCAVRRALCAKIFYFSSVFLISPSQYSNNSLFFCYKNIYV